MKDMLEGKVAGQRVERVAVLLSNWARLERPCTALDAPRERRVPRSTVPKRLKRTAELVQHAGEQSGGQGIAVQVDHLDPAQVQALLARIESEQNRLDYPG